MRAKVTEQGIVIPKEWLEGVETVEIWREAHRIIVAPADQLDPIRGLGADPVDDEITDASIKHDRYLYDS